MNEVKEVKEINVAKEVIKSRTEKDYKRTHTDPHDTKYPSHSDPLSSLPPTPYLSPSPQSYISYSSNEAKFDSDGLPTVYDADLISIYWKREKSALNDRWLEFVRLSVPFLTRLTTLFITEGASNMGKHVGPLARQAREIMQELGPTFVKAGQMMSVRPDVLPDEALEEVRRPPARIPTALNGNPLTPPHTTPPPNSSPYYKTV